MLIRSLLRAAVVAAVAIASASCGDVVRSSRSPSMLVVDSLGTGGTASTLSSDVVDTTHRSVHGGVAVRVRGHDRGHARSRHEGCDGVADDQQPGHGLALSRVVSAIGRAEHPGGGRAVRVRRCGDDDHPGQLERLRSSFEIVRHVAKLEPPLVQLRQNSTVISTIADVTFFGADQVGNEVSVTGSVLINFGNFSDK